MNMQKYGDKLNTILETPDLSAMSASDFSRLLKRKKYPATRMFKLFFRIEIIICLLEIIQEVYAIAGETDRMAIVYSCINIMISAVFIGIFVSLIRRLNDPRLAALPLCEHVEKVFAITKSFYNNYLRFILFYAIMDVGYGIVRAYTIGLDDEYATKFINYANGLSPAYRAIAIIGYRLLVAGLTYLVCYALIYLFYRKSLKRLQQLYNDTREL